MYMDYRYVVPNPCLNIDLPKRASKKHTYLLSPVELEELYHQLNTDTAEGLRNRCMFGIMIYQGMYLNRIKSLVKGDIYLEKGVLIIKKLPKENGRVLKLVTHQQADLKKYVKKYQRKSTDYFFDVNKSYKSRRGLFPKFLSRLMALNEKVYSTKQIRASVITNWLKVHNLREVQYMAGHKYVSSTEQYLDNNYQDLQKALDQYHPLK